MEYKNTLINGYNNLFITNDSKNELYTYWNYDDPKNIKWINYMSTLTKYDSINISKNVNKYLISPILDIGGNNGTLSNELKKNDTNIDITVFDLPQVVNIGKKKFNNIKFIEGSFLNVDTIPNGFKTCIFKSVLHDHDNNLVERLIMNLKNKFNRGIICEVMGNLKDLYFEYPYFDYLIPFSDVIRTQDWYLNLLKSYNYKILEVINCKKTMYTTIIFNIN